MAFDVGDAIALTILALLVLGPIAWAFRHYAVATDARTAARVLRLDASSLAIGGLALAGSVALVAVTFSLPVSLLTILGWALLALGIVGVTIGAANLDWYLATRRLPVVGPEAVESGPVQVEGRAVALDDLLPASVTETDALAYRAAARQEHAILGRGYASSTWVTKAVAHDAAPFSVVGAGALGDDAADGRELPASLRTELDQPDPELPPDVAAVTVDGAAAAYPLLSPKSRLVFASPAGPTLHGLERTVPAEPGTTVPVADAFDRCTRSRPREYSERRIDPGDPVYVLGTARETADGGVEIVDDPDGPPLLAVRTSAEDAIAHAKRFGRTYAILGVAALATGAVLVAGGL